MNDRNVNEKYRHSTYRDSTTTNQTIVKLNQTKATYVCEGIFTLYILYTNVRHGRHSNNF